MTSKAVCKRVIVNVELSNYQADRGLDSSKYARSQTTSSSNNQLKFKIWASLTS